jgi:DNA-binding CsgD family transcriptional regulator
VALAAELGDVAAEAAAERERGVAAMSPVRERFKEWRGQQDGPAHYLEYEPLMTAAMGAVEHFQRALELYEECGDRAGMMSTIISIAYGTKGADLRMGSARRIEEIRRLMMQQHALTRESDRDAQEAQMRYGVHLYARAFGFPDLALERGRDTFDAARRTGDRSLEYLAAGGLALTHLGFGDVAEAAGWLERAAAAAAAAPTPLRARQLEMWKGMAAAAAGDAEEMQGHLERALAMATEQGKPAGRCEVLARLALEAALLGWSLDDAALLAVAGRRGTEALGIAGTLPGDHPWTAQAETALALAAHRGARIEEARDAARRGFAALESTGIREIDPPYPLHLDVVLGVARVLADDPAEEAERVRSQVGAILRMAAERTADEEVRVRWFRGPVQRELAELVGGFEPPAAPAAEPAAFTGLTDHQAGVLRLVTDGKTNREIAGELGVEEEHVSRELAEIYAKLGVSSRAGATVFAFMAGVS